MQSAVMIMREVRDPRGAQRLWPLTLDAEKYFRRLGYKVVDRAEAPKAIMRTKQFPKLCPASAKLMRRELKG